MGIYTRLTRCWSCVMLTRDIGDPDVPAGLYDPRYTRPACQDRLICLPEALLPHILGYVGTLHSTINLLLCTSKAYQRFAGPQSALWSQVRPCHILGT